jgi:hypothetical protein
MPDASMPDSGKPEPKDPYRACMRDADCDPGGLCIQTQSVPNTFTVCAPPCNIASDCPVPAGTYQATVGCFIGYCGLDCTPLLFAPLLSCPEHMACISGQFGTASCHHDDS